jgi:hypothetical protein
MNKRRRWKAKRRRTDRRLVRRWGGLVHTLEHSSQPDAARRLLQRFRRGRVLEAYDRVGAGPW